MQRANPSHESSTRVVALLSMVVLMAAIGGCGSSEDADQQTPDSGAADTGLGDGASSDDGAAGAGGAAADAGSDSSGDSAVSDAAEGGADQDAPDAGGPSECSSYAVQVDVPAYDSSNPAHFLIQSQDDWKHINDPDKRVFYVKPGSYGQVRITASGTASQPRYLALYESSGVHPAKLAKDKQASVKLVFQGAAHWVVHRLSALDFKDTSAMSIQSVSHDIVIDRMHFSNFGTAVQVLGQAKTPTTRNITIQHCRMDPMSAEGIDGDRVAVILSGSPWKEDHVVEDVHIIDNEFRNCNDGVMLLRHPELPGGQKVNYPGTVIECNQFYVDSDVYTDGTGKHDPKGLWALTENAIDLKGGSDDANRPIIVARNYMWGYRRTDKHGGGSGSWGAAFIAHYDVKNIEIYENVVFDSNRAMGAGDPHGLPYSIENAHIHDNIFYNIGFNTDHKTGYVHYFYESKNVVYERNTVVGSNDKQSHWYSHTGNEQGTKVVCNAIVTSAVEAGHRASGTVVEKNFFYATSRKNDGDGKVFSSASDAHLVDLTFTADRYTNHPRQITLHGVKTTSSSPHADWCK